MDMKIINQGDVSWCVRKTSPMIVTATGLRVARMTLHRFVMTTDLAHGRIETPLCVSIMLRPTRSIATWDYPWYPLKPTGSRT